MLLTEDQITRTFLNKVRLNETKNNTKYQILREENENEIIVDRSEDIFEETIGSINSFVGSVRVDDRAMIIYPSSTDVIFNCVISDLNNLKVQFRYNDQSGGLYVWADSMLITKVTADKLAKLVSVKENWHKYWSENITDFIKTKSDGQ